MAPPCSIEFGFELPPSGGRRGRKKAAFLPYLILLAFGVFWLGVVCFAVAHSIGGLWQQLRVGFLYRPVMAQVDQLTPPILGLDEEEDKAGEVRYRYQVAGRWYDGVQSLSPRNEKHKALFAGRVFVEAGGGVTVYHDPDHPARSQLDCEPKLYGLPSLIIVSLFVVVGAVWVALAACSLWIAVKSPGVSGGGRVGLLTIGIHLATYAALSLLGTMAAVIGLTALPWRVELAMGLGLWLVVVPGLTLWLGRSLSRRAKAAAERIEAASRRPAGSRSTRAAGGKARWGLAVFFALFLVVGMVLGAVLYVRPALRIRQARDWRQTPCMILASHVKTPQTDEGTTYRLRLHYSYRVAGQEHTSTRYQLGDEPSGSYNELQALADRFPAGKPATCYANPRDPAEAVLNRESAASLALPRVLSLALALIGASGVLLSLRSSLRRWLGAILAPLVPALILGVLLILGGVGTAFLHTFPVCESLGWRSWDGTPCVILTSRMISSQDDEGNATYRAEIIYAYQAGGKEYRSNRFGPMEFASNLTATKSAILHRYRAGAKATCYVNPRDPAQAVLVRGHVWESLLGIGLVPLGIALGAAGGLVLRLIRGRAREVAAPPAKFTIALGVCLFINGITAMPFWEVLRSFQLGRPAWSTALMLVPFLLVGVGGFLVLLAVALVYVARLLRKLATQP